MKKNDENDKVFDDAKSEISVVSKFSEISQVPTIIQANDQKALGVFISNKNNILFFITKKNYI